MESELDKFCNQSNWLIQLNEYLSVWEGKRGGGEGFKSIKAEEIEVQYMYRQSIMCITYMYSALYIRAFFHKKFLTISASVN